MDVQKLKSDSGLKSGNGEVVNSLRNFGQAASNNIAETVSMPIDAIAWALRKAGIPNSIVGDKPVMGSDWMAEKGFTRPTQEGVSKMAGDFVGMVSPLALEKNVASQLAGALRNFKPKVGNMFIGESANTWDAVSAAQAKALEKQGKTPQEIWKETGTFKGVDGKYRQEIPDNLMKVNSFKESDNEIKAMGSLGAHEVELNKYMAEKLGKTHGTVSGALNHDPLFSAYPDLSTIRLNATIRPDYPFIARGDFSPKNGGQITLAQKGVTDDAANGNILHEIQHAIQNKEGWQRGGSPEDFGGSFDMYQKLAGEAEARATQARMGMDATQRRAVFPYDSYDVPLNQLITK